MASDELERLRTIIREAEEAIEETIPRFLQHCGWVHTCRYPDSAWRWSKAVPPDGTIVAMSEREAYAFECFMRDCADAGGAKCPPNKPHSKYVQ